MVFYLKNKQTTIKMTNRDLHTKPYKETGPYKYISLKIIGPFQIPFKVHPLEYSTHVREHNKHVKLSFFLIVLKCLKTNNIVLKIIEKEQHSLIYTECIKSKKFNIPIKLYGFTIQCRPIKMRLYYGDEQVHVIRLERETINI